MSRGGGGAVGPETLALQREVDTEILIEKEQTIQELRETVDILETKVWRWRKVFVVVHAAVCALVPMHAHTQVKKLEQLVRLKDAKIQALSVRGGNGH